MKISDFLNSCIFASYAEVKRAYNSSIEKLVFELVKNKAFDVARQVEIYAKDRNYGSDEAVIADEELKNIALQNFGQTGYTVMHNHKGLNYFHPNPAIAGTDLSLLKENEIFWNIIEKSFSGNSDGYYDWRVEKGAVRSKYMACRQAAATDFVVCATIYIDDFTSQIAAVDSKLSSELSGLFELTNKTIKNNVRIFFIVLLSVGVLAIIAIAYIARIFIRPIIDMRNAMIKVGEGDFDIRFKIKTNDEIQELSEGLELMANDLKKSRSELDEYNKMLERKVAAKTEELELKLEELEKFKKYTIDRELKMIELKREISGLKEKLNKQAAPEPPAP